MVRLLQILMSIIGFVVILGGALWLSLYVPLEDTEAGVISAMIPSTVE